MVEIISYVIPDQKLERVTLFTEVLRIKPDHLHDDFIKEKLQTEEGTDLLEDSLHQASHAISYERKEYIASLLKNSLTLDDLDHIGKKETLFNLE